MSVRGRTKVVMLAGSGVEFNDLSQSGYVFVGFSCSVSNVVFLKPCSEDRVLKIAS